MAGRPAAPQLIRLAAIVILSSTLQLLLPLLILQTNHQVQAAKEVGGWSSFHSLNDVGLLRHCHRRTVGSSTCDSSSRAAFVVSTIPRFPTVRRRTTGSDSFSLSPCVSNSGRRRRDDETVIVVGGRCNSVWMGKRGSDSDRTNGQARTKAKSKKNDAPSKQKRQSNGSNESQRRLSRNDLNDMVRGT